MIKNKLLDSQTGFYYGSRIGENKSAYNIAEYVEITHPLEIAHLKRAINWVISQNPTLHAGFAEDNGVPYQYTSACESALDVVDLSWDDDGLTTATTLMEKDAERSFSLDKPPLFRQKIIILGENHVLWYFCSHHLLLDGYGTCLFIHQVAEACQNQPPLPPGVTQFPTTEALLRAESDYRESANYLADRQFWQAIVPHLPDPATLARHNMPSGRVIRHTESFTCPAGFFSPQENRPSWVSGLVAAVMAYLYLCSGEKAQVIGIPMMARTGYPERHALVCKTNVLPLALTLGEATTGRQLAREIELELKKIKKHQVFRYEEIKSLRSHFNLSPLFNIVVNIIPFEAATSFSPPQRSLVRNLRSGSAQDLVFNIRPDIDNEMLRFEIDADSGLYDRASLARHGQAVQKLYRLLYAEQGDISLQQLREHFALSVCGKESNCKVDDVLHCIEHTVNQAPHRLAICTPDHPSASLSHLTYAHLQQHVVACADQLAPVCSPNTVLLLDLPKGPEAIICMLASLQLNKPFVNLNSGADEAEYQRVLEQFNDAILITGRTFKRQNLLSAMSHWQNLAGGNPHFTLFRCRRPDSRTDLPAGIGYIMFTSGSTGTPKGVMCSRHSLNAFTAAAINRYCIAPPDRILQFAPLFFDASIEEIFITLASGASLYIAPDITTHEFPALLQFCETYRISLLDLPTAYFNELLFALGAERQLPPTVTTVIVGGESLSERTRAHWFLHHPGGRRLINSYGPTEATVVATAAAVKNDDAPVTIGTPLKGVLTAIVGDNLKPVPVGNPGELLIAGATVSMGYLNQPALSAEKFVSLEVNGQQLPAFRTGDIACMVDDRQLLFLGRKVRETKIAGQRVNMSETESCIAKLPGIVEVAVLAKSGDAGVTLFAHYHGPQPLDESIRRTLYGKLPNSHIPQHFIHHQMPLTKLANGKIDYRTLERHTRTPVPEYEPRPATFMALVHDTWMNILGCDEGDFFSLGGESLQAIKIINTLNGYCQLDLNLRDIFENPEPAALYQHLVKLAHSRYGLSQYHLDIRCAIGQCLSTAISTQAPPALFIQKPDGTDERYLLDRLATRCEARILTSEDEVRLTAGLPLVAAVFSVPEVPSQYVAWLNSLPSLLFMLSGRVQQMIFLYSPVNSGRLAQDLLRDYRHERLRLIRKAGHHLQRIDEGMSELIALCVQLGYFPHIRFDTAYERLSRCVLKSMGIEDGESIDNHAAFAAAQQKNPGMQLCDLSDWLNQVSASGQTRRVFTVSSIKEKGLNS
ncbi:AMP-binding protein [Intestinirhabdus alba]|jgi:nonribosomal peptide synthetase MxcG|uniref:AMP-binding protein n=1 Tax=Intestinirhabdus alba TaxID=2899544 RepID=A0A6L6IHM0_9ENTR|nr:AMP-binding protein [Intestinirhabdus alba]MTH46372.1 AMP-binding protein [Intestinirhabdus alba]